MPNHLALLAFRLFRHEPQSVVLGVHVFFYLLSLLLPFGGAFSVYTHKALAKEIHLDSAHSWMGAALLLANLLHVNLYLMITFPVIFSSFEGVCRSFSLVFNTKLQRENPSNAKSFHCWSFPLHISPIDWGHCGVQSSCAYQVRVTCDYDNC